MSQRQIGKKSSGEGGGLRVVRTKAKRLVEETLVAIGFDRLGRRLRPGRAVIITYHNVVPDHVARTGDLSLHLPVSEFARHLDILCRVGRVVALEELISGAVDDRDHMRFAITFDDGYRGAVTLGVRELERRGLPATIFVAPALLGDQTFWWDALYGDDRWSRPSGLRHRILTAGKGTPLGARQIALEEGIGMRRMPDHSRSAVESELLEAVCKGITVGSHGWSHACLERLSGEALSEEVVRPREWLRSRFGDRYVDVLAYPYGLHSDSVQAAARRAGYRAGFSLATGSLRLSDSSRAPFAAFSLPRLNVPAGLSASRLRVKAAWC